MQFPHSILQRMLKRPLCSLALVLFVLWNHSVASADTIIESIQIEVTGDHSGQSWDSALGGFLGGGGALELLPDVMFCFDSANAPRTCSQVCKNSRKCALKTKRIMDKNIRIVVADIDAGGQEFMATVIVPDASKCTSRPCEFKSKANTVFVKFGLLHNQNHKKSRQNTSSGLPTNKSSPVRKGPVAVVDDWVAPGWAADIMDGATAWWQRGVVPMWEDASDYVDQEVAPWWDENVVDCATDNPRDKALESVAINALKKARALSDHAGNTIEYGGLIIEVNKNYVAGTPQKGQTGMVAGCTRMNGLVKDGYGIWLKGSGYGIRYEKKSDGTLKTDSTGRYIVRCKGFKLNNGIKLAAGYHVHPISKYFWQNWERRVFSAGDLHGAYVNDLKEYMLTPYCNVRQIDPDRITVEPTADPFSGVFDFFSDEFHPANVWSSICAADSIPASSGVKTCN